MKYFFLLFSLAMLTVISAHAQSDKKIIKEKEIIIIEKSDTGEQIEKHIQLSTENDNEIDVEVDSIVNMLISNGNAINSVNVTVHKDENGRSTKKIIIQTNRNGEEKTMQWNNNGIGEVSEGFEVQLDERRVDVEPLPQTKVALGVELDNHLEIVNINPQSSAMKAGLKKGDVIEKIDQQIIYSVVGLLEHLGSYNPGDQVKIQYRRNGKSEKAKLVLDPKI